jgi:chorismate-pyruvate lyase
MEDPATGRSGPECARAPSRSPVDVLTAALAGSQSTVTEVLEELVREPVLAHKLDQGETTAAEGNRLAVEPGHPLARRVTLIRGERSWRAYLYADTLIATDRLPSGTWRRLTTSNDPIGRVIAEDGLPMTRVGVTPERQPLRLRPPGWTGEPIYARRYRLDIASQPVMEIAEWFLPDLNDFLGGDRSM